MTLAFAPERIETWPLARLQPYAKNAKLHGVDQVAKIAASMAEFGWTVPCLVGEDGELIAGHGRVLAATQLGLTEAPVIVLGHLTEAQRRAYRIADNKLTELGSWDEELLSAELNELLAEDFDLSLVGFSDGELDKLLAYVPEGDGEEGGGAGAPPVTIPEPPRNPVSRTGDLWILGDHRLLCGDSTNHNDVRRLMNGERAILFATDPPYLVDYDGTNHPTQNKDWSPSYGTTWDDSSQGAELYDSFIAAAVAEAIADDAAWYCWHASRRQAMLEACWEKAGAFVHQQIIWVKDRGVLTRSHYLWKHEPCFMGWRRPNRPPKVAEETLPSTWALPSFAKDDRPDHPTPKPLDAFGIPMRQHVARGGLCYEPFSGSGSQIMAGEANGRRVFAMEISPAYVDVAVERWQADTGCEAILDLLRATDVPASSIGAAFFGRSFSSAFDGQLTIAGQVALRGTGIGSIPVFNLDNACTATPSALACAVQFVKGGVHDVVLVVGMDKLFSRDRKTSMRSLVGAMDYGEMSYLLSEDSAAAGSKSVIMDHYYARIADAYLAASGATVEDLARVSVKNRMHAAHNPYAQYREPISVEEVLQSPDIAHPLTKLMCSPLSDGAGALLVVSEAVRRRLGGPCVRVAATAVQRGLPEALPDDLPLTTRVARRAYEEAGIAPGDVDLAEVHDASAATELIAVEQLELCPAGGAAAMLRDGRSSLGGSVPVNVSGGLLSRGHPGAGTSAAQLVELVWQLQGSAGPRQVEGARTGIAQSSGGHIGNESATVAVTVLQAAPPL